MIMDVTLLWNRGLERQRSRIMFERIDFYRVSRGSKPRNPWTPIRVYTPSRISPSLFSHLSWNEEASAMDLSLA